MTWLAVSQAHGLRMGTSWLEARRSRSLVVEYERDGSLIECASNVYPARLEKQCRSDDRGCGDAAVHGCEGELSGGKS